MPFKDKEKARAWQRNKWKTNKVFRKRMIRYGVIYTKKRSLKHQKMALEYLGNKCHQCGFNNPIKILEFHHLEKGGKKISTMLAFSWKKIKKELNKTILLCPNCHAIKHLKE